MSHTYHLVCVGCREIFDVGKIVNADEEGRTIPWQMAGWRDQENGEWVARSGLFCVLERFLILHGGHELRLVSEPFLDAVDPEGSLEYIDSASEIMTRTVEPLPDDEADADRVPKDVAERLRRSKTEDEPA